MTKCEVRGTDIFATVQIAASPEAVFAALTEPEQLAAWWGSATSYRTFGWVFPKEVGAKWSGKAGGDPSSSEFMTVHGTILVYDPPRKLSFTWNPQWEPELAETTITFELEPTGTDTLVRMSHVGFGTVTQAATNHSEGWTRIFGWLTEYLEK